MASSLSKDVMSMIKGREKKRLIMKVESLPKVSLIKMTKFMDYTANGVTKEFWFLKANSKRECAMVSSTNTMMMASLVFSKLLLKMKYRELKRVSTQMAKSLKADMKKA